MGKTHLILGIVFVVAGLGIVISGAKAGFVLVALGVFRLVRAYLAYEKEKQLGQGQ